MKKLLLLFALVLMLFTITSVTTTNDKKVIVCHVPPGNPANAHDIEISINALQTHLNHGDYVGGCDK